jgi:uncharacterized membrane protein YkoI
VGYLRLTLLTLSLAGFGLLIVSVLNVRNNASFALQTTMDTPIAPTALWTTTLKNPSRGAATPIVMPGDFMTFKQAYLEARRAAIEWDRDAVIISALAWHEIGKEQARRVALDQGGKAAQWLFSVATIHKMSEVYVGNDSVAIVGIDGVPGNEFMLDEPMPPGWPKQQEIQVDDVLDSDSVVSIVKQRDLNGWKLTKMRLDGNQWRLGFELPQRSRYIIVNAKTGEILSDTETPTS